MGKTLDDTTIKILAAKVMGDMLTRYLMTIIIAGELRGHNEIPFYSVSLMNILRNLEEERRKELNYGELNEEQRQVVQAYVCSLLDAGLDEVSMLEEITPPELFEEFKSHLDNNELPEEFIKRLREKLTN